MNEILENIRTRRAIRHFKPDPIPADILQQILEAGLWAPSAGGRQQPLFLVSSNREINLQLGRINRRVFGGAMKQNLHEVNEKQISIAEDETIQNAFYDAPVVVTIFAPEYRFTVNDCSVAAQNLMLAAWSLGIGSVHVGRSEETFASEEGKALMKKAGIPEDAHAVVCVCLGYPDGEIGEGKSRKTERIRYVD